MNESGSVPGLNIGVPPTSGFDNDQPSARNWLGPGGVRNVFGNQFLCPWTDLSKSSFFKQVAKDVGNKILAPKSYHIYDG